MKDIKSSHTNLKHKNSLNALSKNVKQFFKNSKNDFVTDIALSDKTILEYAKLKARSKSHGSRNASKNQARGMAKIIIAVSQKKDKPVTMSDLLNAEYYEDLVEIAEDPMKYPDLWETPDAGEKIGLNLRAACKAEKRRL